MFFSAFLLQNHDGVMLFCIETEVKEFEVLGSKHNRFSTSLGSRRKRDSIIKVELKLRNKHHENTKEVLGLYVLHN